MNRLAAQYITGAEMVPLATLILNIASQKQGDPISYQINIVHSKHAE